VSPHAQIDPLERAIVLALREERARKAISANALAAMIGVDRSTITHIESDRVRPTLWVILKICEGLSLDLSEIAGKARKNLG
jgi:DNA-binding XRE family transcriptional regulator